MQRDVNNEHSTLGATILPMTGTGLRVVRDGRVLIDGLDIEISGRAHTTVFVGPNGAGKSLLLRLLAGLVAPDAGHVLWAGDAPSDRNRPQVGVVFQRPVLLRRSAIANVEYALKVAGVATRDRRERASAALADAGLAAVADSPARLLSGGEQQRLALARALALHPSVVFLDEPTANVDPASTAAIERRLCAARDRGTRIVLVTQDLGQARRLADDVLFMHMGRIVERAPAAAFFAAPQTREAAMFLNGEIVL